MVINALNGPFSFLPKNSFPEFFSLISYYRLKSLFLKMS